MHILFNRFGCHKPGNHLCNQNKHTDSTNRRKFIFELSEIRFRKSCQRNDWRYAGNTKRSTARNHLCLFFPLQTGSPAAHRFGKYILLLPFWQLMLQTFFVRFHPIHFVHFHNCFPFLKSLHPGFPVLSSAQAWFLLSEDNRSRHEIILTAVRFTQFPAYSVRFPIWIPNAGIHPSGLPVPPVTCHFVFTVPQYDHLT